MLVTVSGSWIMRNYCYLPDIQLRDGVFDINICKAIITTHTVAPRAVRRRFLQQFKSQSLVLAMSSQHYDILIISKRFSSMKNDLSVDRWRKNVWQLSCYPPAILVEDTRHSTGKYLRLFSLQYVPDFAFDITSNSDKILRIVMEYTRTQIYHRTYTCVLLYPLIFAGRT